MDVVAVGSEAVAAGEKAKVEGSEAVRVGLAAGESLVARVH